MLPLPIRCRQRYKASVFVLLYEAASTFVPVNKSDPFWESRHDTTASSARVCRAYAHVCSRMLTYADPFWECRDDTSVLPYSSIFNCHNGSTSRSIQKIQSRSLNFIYIYIYIHTYIHTYIYILYAGVCWRMYTYADVCWRVLTYADVRWRTLLYRVTRNGLWWYIEQCSGL